MSMSCIRQQGMVGVWHALALVGVALAVVLPALCVPRAAYAATPFLSASKGEAVRIAPAPTSKELAAYNRALKACMDYENQPNPIVVDVSDLGLTQAQALHVGYLLHSNGELFWANTFDDKSFGANTFTIPITYGDAEITQMRKELDAAVAKAKKRLASGMSQAMKVHVLHDYLLDATSYADKQKSAYMGLVKGKADCFGFAQSMDVLLRRAGFSVDMAYNDAGDHAWNLVKVNGKWYHVDPTWDNGYTGKKYSKAYNWKHSRCHLYLLQSDKSMRFENIDERGSWWAHHKCTSNKYVMLRDNTRKDNWEKYCNDYKLYTKGFTSGGLKYKLCGSKKAKLVGVSAAKKKKAKTIDVPATVTRKKKTYKVVGIGAGAFANAKAKTLRIASRSLSAGRVKGSLTGSKVKQIKLVGSARKKQSSYKAYFARANSGKKVSVKR